MGLLRHNQLAPRHLSGSRSAGRWLIVRHHHHDLPGSGWTWRSSAAATSDRRESPDPPTPPRLLPAPDRQWSKAYGHRRATHPTRGSRPAVQFPQALGDRVRRHPGSPGHQADPAPAQLTGLRAQHKPALPLIQMETVGRGWVRLGAMPSGLSPSRVLFRGALTQQAAARRAEERLKDAPRARCVYE